MLRVDFSELYQCIICEDVFLKNEIDRETYICIYCKCDTIDMLRDEYDEIE